MTARRRPPNRRPSKTTEYERDGLHFRLAAGYHPDGEIGEDEIAAFIKDVSHHDAGPDNVQRVAAKLAAAGWPLTGVGDGSV